MDAVEANVGKLVQAVRAGGTSVKVTGIDLKRDRGQDWPRGLKTLGWLILAAGIGLQIVAVWLTGHPGLIEARKSQHLPDRNRSV
jgi:hypothetical protein